MKLTEHFERIKKMNLLIRTGHTGTPAEFALMIGVSTSHLFRYLNEIEHYGMAIRYSRSLKTYFYNDNNELFVSYSLKVINANSCKEILQG